MQLQKIILFALSIITQLIILGFPSTAFSQTNNEALVKWMDKNYISINENKVKISDVIRLDSLKENSYSKPCVNQQNCDSLKFSNSGINSMLIIYLTFKTNSGNFGGLQNIMQDSGLIHSLFMKILIASNSLKNSTPNGLFLVAKEDSMKGAVLLISVAKDPLLSGETIPSLQIEVLKEKPNINILLESWFWGPIKGEQNFADKEYDTVAISYVDYWILNKYAPFKEYYAMVETNPTIISDVGIDYRTDFHKYVDYYCKKRGIKSFNRTSNSFNIYCAQGLITGNNANWENVSVFMFYSMDSRRSLQCMLDGKYYHNKYAPSEETIRESGVNIEKDYADKLKAFGNDFQEKFVEYLNNGRK